MRITNPQNSNGDKLLSVAEITNRYKKVSKVIPISGDDLGIVYVSSSDIDGEDIADYQFVSATIETTSEGTILYQPDMTIEDNQLKLVYFDSLEQGSDFSSYSTVITLENVKSGVNTNVDATQLATEIATRAAEDAKIITELADVSKSVFYGDSMIETMACDLRKCTLKFGEIKETASGVEYLNDGHYYYLTPGKDASGVEYTTFETEITLQKYSGSDRVCTFYVIIDLRNIGGTPIVSFNAENDIHWLGTGGTAPIIQASSYNVLGFCQLGEDVIVGNMVFSF